MKYLVVEKNTDGSFEVVLNSGRCKEKKDIFIIQQSAASSNSPTRQCAIPIQDKSSVAIQHKPSQRILTVKVKSELGQQTTITSDIGAQWFRLTVVHKDQDTPHNDFKLGEVKDISNFNCGLGFASALYTQSIKLRQLLEGQLNEQLLQIVTLELRGALLSLQSWLDSSEGKKRANLIRTLQILDLLLGLIAIIPPTHDGLHDTVITISLVLEKYATVANQKSLDYMMEEKRLTPLIKKVGTGCGVENVIVAIVKANPNATASIDLEEKIREQLVISATSQCTSEVSTLRRNYPSTNSPEVDDLLKILKYSGVSSDLDSQYFSMQKALIAPEGAQQNTRYNPNVHKALQLVAGQSKASLVQHTITRWEHTFNYDLLSIEHLDIHKESIADLVPVLTGDSSTQVVTKERTPASSADKLPTQLKLLALHRIRILLKTQLHSTLKRTVLDFKMLRIKSTESLNVTATDVQNGKKAHKSNTDGLHKFFEGTMGRVQGQGLSSEGFRRILSLDVPSSLLGVKETDKAKGGQRHRFGSAVPSEYEDRYDFTPPPDSLHELLKEITLDESPTNQDRPDVSESVIKLATERMKHNLDKCLSSYFNSETKDGQCLSQALLKLLDSNEQKLQLRCAEYLFDIFSAESILLAELASSYLVSNETANSTEYKEMVSLGTWQDEKKMLWNIGKKKAAEREELLEVLQRLADYCVMKENKFLPNSVHQNIAYSCGIFSSVLGYLLQHMSSSKYNHENVVRRSMKLLQAIARSNAKVQRRLFKILLEFLEAKMAISAMAKLLNEVFANNPVVSSKITHEDIRQILYTALSGGSTEHSELLTVLRTVVKEAQETAGLIVIEDNITKLFSSYWPDCVLSDILGKKNSTHHYEILAKAQEGSGELHLLLNTTFLIAVCCERECRTAESLAQELFSLPELLGIITDSSITCDRKVPFARILTHTYLLTERDSGQACAKIARNIEFWVHLENITAIVLQLTVLVQKLEPQIKIAIQQQLQYIGGYQISVLEWELMTAQAELSIPLPETGEKFKKESVPLNKVILYLMEGFLPLLSGFSSKLCAHICGQNKECIEAVTPQKMQILYEFNKTLQRLKLLRLDTINFDTRTDGGESTIRSCLNNTGLLLVTVNTEGASGIDVSGSYCERPRRSLQPTHGALELQLNKELDVFVANYHKFFMKENEDNESDDPSLAIPRGENYKHLVCLFVDDQASTRSLEPLKIQKLLTLLNSIQTIQQQNIDCQEHTKFDRMLVVSLKVLYSAVSQMISQMTCEETLAQLQVKFFALDPLRKLTKLLKDPRDDIAFYVLACFHLFLSRGGEKMHQTAMTLIREEGKELFKKIHGMLDRVQFHLRSQKSTKTSLSLNADFKKGNRRVSDLFMNPVMVIRNPLSKQEEIVEEAEDAESKELPDKLHGGNDDEDNVSSSTTFSMSTVEDFKVLISAPVATDGAAAKTDFIDPRISIALDIISHVCDHQERFIQDMLREEQGFKKSSIIAQLVFLLDHLAKSMTKRELPVAMKTIVALTQICFGNFNNQEIAIQGQIVMSINCLLEMHFFYLSAHLTLLELKSKAIDLLDVLLEETDERSSTVAEWVIADLDQCLLVETMKELWLFLQSCNRSTDTRKWNRTLFKAYHVLRRIADYEGITVDQLVGHCDSTDHQHCQMSGSGDQSNEKMWIYCKDRSRNIEAVYKSHNGQDILTRIYYPIPPTTHLSDSDKKTMLNGLNQGKPEEELTDLLRWIKSFRKYHWWKRQLKDSWKTKWICFASGIRQTILFWLTIALMFFLLFGLDIHNNSVQVCSPYLLCHPYNTAILIILVCRFIHLVLAIWMLVEYYLKSWPTFIFHIPVVSNLLYRLKRKSEHKRSIKVIGEFIDKHICCGRFTIQRPKEPKHFSVHLFSFEPIYRVIFTLCSALGLFVHVYFYTFCLIYILLRNDILKDILSSVRAAAPQLLTVAILGIVILFGYGAISFIIYSAVFDPQVGLYCTTLFECFVSVSRIGLLETLGLNLPLSANGTEPGFTTVAFRAVFDLSFFVIVTLLGFNIVIAIMVDQFQHLRQRKQEVFENINNNCLVCSIERDVFERYGQDFRTHVKQEHSLWNYIFFILYLDGVDQCDQSALEAYVYKQIPKDEAYLGSIDFFPVLQAKSLPEYKPNRGKEW